MTELPKFKVTIERQNEDGKGIKESFECDGLILNTIDREDGGMQLGVYCRQVAPREVMQVSEALEAEATRRNPFVRLMKALEMLC